MNSTGIPLETAYPYAANSTYYTSAGKPICSATTNRIKLSYPMNNIYFYNVINTEQLQQFLNDYGPISVGVYASHNGFWYAGASGAIECPASFSYIDHAVLLVGYNSTHWIIKNSWGTTWGQGGFGYIRKDNDCGLKSYVNVAMVKFNASPNPPNPSVANVTLIVSLTDSYGDGWNGNVITIKQDNLNYQFGPGFTSGRTYGPQQISVKGNV